MLYSGLPDRKYTQIGMVHGGISGCDSHRYPGIYTNMEHPEILTFIKTTIGLLGWPLKHSYKHAI